MKAVLLQGHGGPEVLQLGETAQPVAGPHQLLVRVQCTALNRADTMQRKGHYPPPAGESELLGLELADDVVALGPDTDSSWLGKRVFGLVGGGAYAEYALLHEQLAMVIPSDWSYQQAAAVPEVYLTADETIFTLGGLDSGHSLLLHAAASGVGTAAVQMARCAGATVYGTAGSQAKLDALRQLGIHRAIDYHHEDFVDVIQQSTEGQGVDVVEDFIGGAYLARNLSVLKEGGRLIIVSLLDGVKAELNLALILRKRLQIKGSVLRTRRLADKIRITQRFRQRWLPLLQDHTLVPVIDSVYPLSEVQQAHQRMDQNLNCGKIMLSVSAMM